MPIGEADLVVTLFTASHGVIAAAARSARSSSRRFGALEPIHELAVTLEVREGAEVGKLVEARIERLRPRATGALDRIDAAGRLLRWTRRGSPAHVPEPRAFSTVSAALDALDADVPVEAASVLAIGGLALVEALGWGLDLDRCVACGRACPESSAASIDPVRGGLVCLACGGARRVWSAPLRARVRAARAGGAPLAADSSEVVVEMVEAVLDAHVAPLAAPQAPRSGSR